MAKSMRPRVVTLNTCVPEIKVRVWSNGVFQLVDEYRERASDITSYQGIAILEMPDNLKSEETGRGYWIWLSKYWKGVLPTEILLEVF